MQRLKDVGMNCGCEYTSFPLFSGIDSYSRFDHSIGTGLIIWNFTKDKKQTIAALLHDIATPTFAHVVDFLHGDYLVQESTENGTAERIASSPELQRILSALGLRTEDVCDYHLYPLADNPTPRLSADRLEYSFGNMLNFGFRDLAALQKIYDSLCVSKNEEQTDELCFNDLPSAVDFAHGALQCSHVYVSDADRYSMQILSDLLRSALQDRVILPEDLDGTEPFLIEKMESHPVYDRLWKDFCAMSELESSSAPSPNGDWRRIPAKKRYIDPLVAGMGRVSELDKTFREKMSEFLDQPQDIWLRHRKEEP